jgi:hypothetical protein
MAILLDQITVRDREEIYRVLVALHEVVQDAGADYIYPGNVNDSCFYVILGQHSCLASRVLGKLGVPAPVLSRWEGFSMGQLNYVITGLHQAARLILDRAQRLQDSRTLVWGEILNEITFLAEKEYGVTV